MWPTRVQNLKSLAVAVAEIFLGVYNSKMSHVTMTTPLSGMTCHHRLGLATINLQTKFEG